MRHSITSIAIALPLLAGSASVAFAQTAVPVGGSVAVLTQPVVTQPASGVVNPAEAGQRFYTHLEILTQFRGSAAQPLHGPPFPGYFYETPASLACIYDLAPRSSGCDPNLVNLNPSGGAKAIAIVDAYDDPNAYDDLQFFSSQFGIASITPTSFTVVYAPFGGSLPGSCGSFALQPFPAQGTGWDIEESLDIEWAHAMAPLASLYLVEAQSPSSSDMNCAVSIASGLVAAAGGGEVSMSWGMPEYPTESFYDPVFTTPKVVYFASAGDSPGVWYPSASPNVVSVGGTTLSTNATTGNFIGENVWQDTGGGPSAYEPKPSYQSGIATLTTRGTPDIASDANPYTGVWVFDSLTYDFPEWFIVGGTSVSSPTWAGIVNRAGSFSASSKAELTKLYDDSSADFNDITLGSCGLYLGYFAGPGWDLCSGLGSPRGYGGK